jgi:SAM-dependent methyltransferase
MRAVIDALSNELFGRSLPLPEFPLRKDLVGIGLTDHAYDRLLVERFTYENTYLDREPRLDLAAIDEKLAGKCDFLTASDVFEHVVPPVDVAFRNSRRLLKPGGVLVLTVPHDSRPDTLEHYPDLYDWKIADENGETVLRNVTQCGDVQTFPQPLSHEGSGLVLEMRFFSHADLIERLHAAGYSSTTNYNVERPGFGIMWPAGGGWPIAARA